MKNSLKMIISLVVVMAVLFVMVNYAFATSALTPSNAITSGSAEVPDEDDDTNTNANTNGSGRVIINTNSSSNNTTTNVTNRVNVVNTNTNNLPATGQEDIFVVGGMLIVLLGVAGYTYYKMKNSVM